MSNNVINFWCPPDVDLLYGSYISDDFSPVLLSINTRPWLFQVDKYSHLSFVCIIAHLLTSKWPGGRRSWSISRPLLNLMTDHVRVSHSFWTHWILLTKLFKSKISPWRSYTRYLLTIFVNTQHPGELHYFSVKYLRDCDIPPFRFLIFGSIYISTLKNAQKIQPV